MDTKANNQDIIDAWIIELGDREATDADLDRLAEATGLFAALDAAITALTEER
jgi:hypothetical protein